MRTYHSRTIVEAKSRSIEIGTAMRRPQTQGHGRDCIVYVWRGCGMYAACQGTRRQKSVYSTWRTQMSSIGSPRDTQSQASAVSVGEASEAKPAPVTSSRVQALITGARSSFITRENQSSSHGDQSSRRKNTHRTKRNDQNILPISLTGAQKFPATISITARLPFDAAQWSGVDPFPARTVNSAPYTPTSSFTTCSPTVTAGQSVVVVTAVYYMDRTILLYSVGDSFLVTPNHHRVRYGQLLAAVFVGEVVLVTTPLHALTSTRRVQRL